MTAPRIRRVYDDPAPEDGLRVLIDRLWPRGLSKEEAAVDEWCRDVAPSTELRKWFAHDPERFAEFAARYRLELDEPDRRAALTALVTRIGSDPVTLLTATKQPEVSHAVVLADVIGHSP